MKKFLIIMSVLFLTGCGNDFICEKEYKEEDYITKEKIICEFDKSDNITNVSVEYIMTFENDKTAKAYSTVLKNLDDDFDINLDGKKITVKGSKNYSQYEGNKKTLEEEFEKSGYACK